ncbi:MAG: ATP-binding cassette domain-containing protein [Candidatus Saccharibacteria bacterium]|nr:ATP-binding cassette domain-containing protein [Candidatus Saccharibacteria bacterium]
MLEVKNISFVADGRKILDNVSFRLEPGSFLVITGPNGSGKSTLAQILMGIKKPSAGQILFDSQDITEFSVTERAKLGLAFAFQQPVKFKGLTVRELLEIAGKNVEGVLTKVGLDPTEYLDRELSSTLSGGELKRIEIASALAREAKLTIFDEPEAGIDLWSFEKLTDTFSELRDQTKDRSIMIISHQERILKIADQIMILEKGKIKSFGPATEILPKILEGQK